jgi:hypothetical protein
VELIRTPDKALEYFRSLSESFLPEGNASPLRLNFIEFQNENIGNNLSYPLMILAPMRNGLDDKLSDNRQLIFKWELWFLLPVSKGDESNQREAIRKCFEYSMDILGMMDYHWQHTFPVDQRPFRGLDMNSIEWDEIGPLGRDNAYGVSMSGNFSNPVNLKRDPLKWIS